MGSSAFYQGFNPALQTMPDNGKGKAREADFETAFAQAFASLQTSETESSAKIVELDENAATLEQISDAVKTNSDFVEFVIFRCLTRYSDLAAPVSGIICKSQMHPHQRKIWQSGNQSLTNS